MEPLTPRFRHKPSFVAARSAAESIRRQLKLDDTPFPIGLVLGTGWGDTLPLTDAREISFTEIPGFNDLGELEGHRRTVVCGRLDGTPVVALRGRVHLNESPVDPAIYQMVRLQTEMLIHLGVKTLVLTCAAGSLTNEVEVGDIVFVNGFVTVFAPPMPLHAGEFVSPDDVLDHHLTHFVRARVTDSTSSLTKASAHAFTGGHAMVLGPYFEGRMYDKPLLASSGASVVGMSVLPEACVAALYRDEGVRAVPIAFVTNTASEEHSHAENMRRAKATSAVLGDVLRVVITLAAK